MQISARQSTAGTIFDVTGDIDLAHLAFLEKPYTVEQLLNAIASGITPPLHAAGHN